MIAQVPSWITDAGVFAGVVVAFVAAVRALTGWAPLRWVLRRLVHDPMRDGLRQVLSEEFGPMLEQVKAELTYNGGASTKDMVRNIHRTVGEIQDEQAQVRARLERLEAG